jgi:hypothetical protein
LLMRQERIPVGKWGINFIVLIIWIQFPMPIFNTGLYSSPYSCSKRAQVFGFFQ